MHAEAHDEAQPETYSDTVKSKKKTPKRVFSRKTLLDELLSKSFGDEVSIKAVDEYERVTRRRNFQDAKRKGLLFGCLLRVYRDSGVLFDLRSVAEKMGIKQAVASRGVRLYCECARTLGEHVERLEPEPIQYVHLLVGRLVQRPEDWCTAGFREHVEHTSEGAPDTEHVCRCLESVLSYLSRRDVPSTTKSSTPRCVAAASIYFHFVARGCTVNKEHYAELCGCAPVSIEKLSDDIAGSLRALRALTDAST
jgi:transcription initiation factor TFIIIB Brf1 subunit/transcription initiation factor TFIIB